MKIKNQFLFIAFFVILGLLSLRLPLSSLVGSQAKFTLFDLLAPTAGAFIGTLPGIAAILVTQVINTLFHGGFVDTASFIRPFPTLFAVWYFSRKSKATLIVPVLAILAFILNPVGRTVWYYALFWLIPILSYRFHNRLFLRSLGSTFTAHAVGGALWVWIFHLPASFWQGLIPVVITERLIFAVGISVVYLVLTKTLGYIRRVQFSRRYPFQEEASLFPKGH